MFHFIHRLRCLESLCAMQAFLRFGCFTKTFTKTFVSTTKCVPSRETLQRPCISQRCRRNLRNLLIVARQYRVPYSKSTLVVFPSDKNKGQEANWIVATSNSISTVLVRCFVSVIVSLLALCLNGRQETLATNGKTLESTNAALVAKYDSSIMKSFKPLTVMVKNTKLSEQSQTKHKTNGSSKEVVTPPKVQLANSERFITWSLTLLVFAGVCFVLYKMSLKEEEEEAKAIEREYQRLEQLKREFIEADDDSPVRDEDLLSSLRKRLENQTQQDNQGPSEEDDQINDATKSAETENTTEPVQDKGYVSSEKAASTEGVSVEHLDMLRRMYEGTSTKNTEDGTVDPEANKEDDRNAPNDTMYDEKGSKGRKSRT